MAIEVLDREFLWLLGINTQSLEFIVLALASESLPSSSPSSNRLLRKDKDDWIIVKC